MRPVVRGDRPLDGQGNEIEFKEYIEARGLLIDRIGGYCSYCEMRLEASLAVEHVQPKKHDGIHDLQRELDWNNFLLACVHCNSTKGKRDVVLENYVWPDKDNTFRALKYSEGGVISPAECLSDEEKTTVQRTIELTGIDKRPPEASAADRRWLGRSEAWDIATHAFKRLHPKAQHNEGLREQIVDTMVSRGYWSIWMTIFKSDADMCRRFIEAMPGTAENCFDSVRGYEPVPRPSGKH